MTEILIYLPLGVVAGVLAGLFGIGGGIIFVPVLLLAFEFIGMHGELLAHLAIGTSLACVVFTGLSSTLAHQRKGAVMWPWVIKMAPFLIAGGAIGGWTADQLPGQILIVMLGTFLLVMSFQFRRWGDSHAIDSCVCVCRNLDRLDQFDDGDCRRRAHRSFYDLAWSFGPLRDWHGLRLWDSDSFGWCNFIYSRRP